MGTVLIQILAAPFAAIKHTNSKYTHDSVMFTYERQKMTGGEVG